eukprot:4257450-Alexandrium_andersonii.AAC.1
MSASLVGSEMCIRDRVDKQHSAAKVGPGLGKAGIREVPGRCERAEQVPVSYTHLTLPTICSV